MKRLSKLGFVVLLTGLIGWVLLVGLQPAEGQTLVAGQSTAHVSWRNDPHSAANGAQRLRSMGQTAVPLTVQTAVTAFPFSIDAFVLTPDADWTSSTPQDANYGFSVDTAGDVNGDGFDDVIVGANWFDNGEPDEGAAFVFLGGANGLRPVFNWRVESNLAHEEFGIAVAAAGDVNNDGYDDVIVGTNSPLPTLGGKVYLFLGSPVGLADAPAWAAAGEQLADLFGTAVASAGDVNGDSYDDVIVGAPNFVGQQGLPTGRAYVFYGESGGLSAAPDWIAEGNGNSRRFGVSVDTAGDVNNDGYDDVIIGDSEYAPDGVTGLAAIYLGGSGGLPVSSPPIATINDAASVQYGDFVVAPPYHQFGFSVSTAGDVNDDGFADVVVGAPGYGDGLSVFGAAYLFYGSAAGDVISRTFLSAYVADSMYGHDVGTAGDVNNDGYDDVFVGAPGYEVGFRSDGTKQPTAVGGGAAFVYPGAALAITPTAIWSGASLQVDARYGTAVATAGDVNGDGFADMLVGAPQLLNPFAFAGQAFAYYGSGVIPALTAVNSSPTPVGQPTFFQAAAPGAGFLHYEWTFGDGGTAVGQNIGHVYTTPGLYTAIVTATSLTDVAYATTPVTITVDSTITPGEGGQLTFTNPETGLGLNVNVPPGAVTDLLQLSYTPLVTISQPSPTNTISYYFDLNPVEAKRVFLPVVMGGNGVEGSAVFPTSLPFNATSSFPFLQPVSVTIFYNEDTLPPGASETDMKLLYWDIPSQTWLDIATSCSPTSTYTYNPAENWFQVDICHLSRFGVVH